MAPGRINGGPPRSPQQSANGEHLSESHLGPCGIPQQAYGHDERFSNAIVQPEMSTHEMIYHHEGAPVFDGYGSFHGFPSESDYPPILPVQHPAFGHTTQINTPPIAADEGIITRSGRSIPPLGSPISVRNISTDKPRVIRPPRASRRAKQGKADRGSSPIITAPLSRLTAHLTNIPVKDMEAWVNRPAEVRHKEAQKNKKIARPMNSFMLYRSAYANRTKEWCSQNNHQVISRVSGQSWPLEPQEVRERFELLAIMERDNHQKAHPGYKFAPNKNQTPPKKKRTLEEEPSDLDDVEYGLHSAQARKQARSAERDSSYYSRSSTPLESQELFQPAGSNRSSWQMNNPGRPMLGMLSPPEHMHYFQPSIHRSMMGANVEDVRFRKMGLPGVQYSETASLAGLPGVVHHELLQPHSNVTTPGQSDDSQLDPQLLAFDNGHGGIDAGSGTYNGSQYAFWQADHGANSYLPVNAALTSNQPPYHIEATYHHPGMQTLTDGHDVWDLSHGTSINEVGKDFDQWLDT